MHLHLSQLPTTDELQLGRELLREGVSFPQTRLRLVAHGATHASSELAIAQLAQESAAHDLALRRPAQEIRNRLTGRGLDLRQADDAIAAARSHLTRRLCRAGVANPRAYVAALMVCLVVLAALLASALGKLELPPHLGTALLVAAVASCFYARHRSRQHEVG